MKELILQINHLRLQRSGQLICKDLNLTLQRGELLTVSGPNGAGKTSLLRGLAGLHDTGDAVRWQTCHGNGYADYQASRVVYIGHQSGLRPKLSVYENLRFYAELMDCREHLSYSAARQALAYFQIAEQADLLCARLSAGQKQRVALTRLLIATASLWLLDEPSASLDTDGVQLLNDLLVRHLEGGGAAVVATHRPITLKQGKLTQLSLPC